MGDQDFSGRVDADGRRATGDIAKNAGVFDIQPGLLPQPKFTRTPYPERKIRKGEDFADNKGVF